MPMSTVVDTSAACFCEKIRVICTAFLSDFHKISDVFPNLQKNRIQDLTNGGFCGIIISL